MLIVINGTFFVQMLMVGLQWGPSCRGRKWVLNYIKPTFDNTVCFVELQIDIVL